MFSFWSVYYKSCRQVLTPVDNSQHLLRLPNLDKTRLAAFHLQYNEGNYNNWFFIRKRKAFLLYSQILVYAGKASNGKTVKLITKNCKAQTKKFSNINTRTNVI
jgi:hypothetical protein